MLEPFLAILLAPLVGLSLDALKVMPNSTIFVFLLSVAINLVMSLANRMFINIEEYREWTIKSTMLRRELMEAVRSGNKRLVNKLQKEQDEMMKVQSKMTQQRLKINLFFFIPLIALWQVLTPLYGKNPVALVPFNAPFFAPRGLWNFGAWYIFSSLTANILLSRLLGLTFEI